MRRRQRLNGPNGLSVLLDADEIDHDNPGNGTPALCEMGRDNWRTGQQKLTGTYWCCQGTGEIDCGTDLNPAQMRWLDEIEPKVDAFLAAFPKGDPR